MQAEPLPPPASGAFSRLRDPVNGLLHFSALLLALVGTAWLLGRTQGDTLRLAGALIYGAGMCACFLASSLHHLVRGSRALEMRLLKIDHAAIYAFIAGSYAPVCLRMLPAPGGGVLLALVWAIALVGIVYKLGFAPDQVSVDDPPPLIDTLLYIAMGWLAAPQALSLFHRCVGNSFWLLVASGVAYSFGGLILSRRWFDFWPGRFGHHEIWHLFVMAGSGLMFAFIAVNVY